MIDLILAGKQDVVSREHEGTGRALNEIAALAKFALADLSGRPLTVAQLSGRVPLVEFWATRCPPCHPTLEWLGELKHKCGDRIAIMALAVESPEDKIRSTANLLSTDLDWAVADAATAWAFGDITAVPTMFVFDPSGKTARVLSGEPPALHKQAGEILDALIKQPNATSTTVLRKLSFPAHHGNADGTFAPGHNGEEAFTTLAPFFGFCEADDPALSNHAKLAFTEDNPLYEPAVDGIWWDRRGAWGSGITTPGQMAMLVGINNETELQQRLDQLRTLIDLDGSIWWWPYLYPCNDRRNIRRRDWPTDTSKSGFTMAIASCLFVNNLIGMSVDARLGGLRFVPFALGVSSTGRGRGSGIRDLMLPTSGESNESQAGSRTATINRMKQ